MEPRTSGRIPLLDLLRGLAIALMVGYHLCFDLDYYGRLEIDFNHSPLWLGLRTLIVSLFLGVMGASLQLATAGGIRWPRYLRRLAWLLGCAGAVSLGSYLLFPKSYIFFGVLHFIAAASLLGLLFRRLYALNGLLGAGLILLGLTVESTLFDHPALQWVGLMSHKPVTEDYVPLLPWFGVVLLGMALGRWLSQRPPDSPLRRWPGGVAWAHPLRLAGRHGLLIYMLHQPLLLGLLYPLS